MRLRPFGHPPSLAFSRLDAVLASDFMEPKALAANFGEIGLPQ